MGFDFQNWLKRFNEQEEITARYEGWKEEEMSEEHLTIRLTNKSLRFLTFVKKHGWDLDKFINRMINNTEDYCDGIYPVKKQEEKGDK